MDRVNVDLEHCYGIKRLQTQFDFSEERAYAIYAPNGVMKSSLAQTFQDVASGVPSTDRIFPKRTSKRVVTDEHGADLPKESVLAVRPYDETLGHTEKTSTLLVDTTLRKEYEQLHVGIESSKKALLDALKKQSGSRKDIEKEISSTFTSSDDEFYTALARIKKELLEQTDTPFADVRYDVIFDEKVLAFLARPDVKAAIEDYVTRYNELLAASTYFKRGTFDYYNAAQIAKSLADNGFFAAEHTVNLNAEEKLEIRTQEELEDVINREKEGIITDDALRKGFDAIERLITKNVTLRDFQRYMVEHEALLSQLANVSKFKEHVWKSYLRARIDLYRDLIEEYEAAESRRREIEDAAARQRTQWEEVIDIFNERFFVPFKLSAKNRVAVMLGHEPMISLGFTYHDGAESAPVERASLLKALSAGEKKALYVLNIIFEVEVRRKAAQETLIVIDDIADSFDYQNKYAIIQYLRDISEYGVFRQIIMTHNFDFFRTVNSRFVTYPHCLMASKGSAGLSLDQASGIRNVFARDWKDNFFTDGRKKVACIPFIRNLIEYTSGETDARYARLTSLLHWKADSASITQADLDGIYNGVFAPHGASADAARPMMDVISDEAKACMTAGVGMNLENKIVLAIAIRIAAERFMVEKIRDDVFVAGIGGHQTQALVHKFRELFPGETEALMVLDRVMLMTPENIHLNSFMYEPIIDMSDEHLRRLYADVLSLDASK